MLKLNCIYQSLKKVTGDWHAGHFQWAYTWSYVQFFENGTAAYYLFNSEDTNAISNWFARDEKNGLRGKFQYKNDKGQLIIGETKSEISIYNDRIIIHWSSGPEMYFPIS